MTTTRTASCLLLEQVFRHYQQQPNKTVFAWIGEKGKQDNSLTFRQLWELSGGVADKLVQSGLQPGDRVMTAYPFGLEFIVGFLGCLRAGLVVVSVYPPNLANLKKDIPKFNKFVLDSGASVVITTQKYSLLVTGSRWTGIGTGGAKWATGLTWISTDRCQPTASREFPDAQPTASDLAFIQYTSGSTGQPKGVMISHGAVTHNLLCISELGQFTPDSVGVCWLPQYHDYGLVVNYLNAISRGFLLVCASPLTFIKNPLLWGELVERYSGTHVASPNFGYALLFRRMREANIKFDFSSIVKANTAAEPINPAVLDEMNLVFPPGAVDQTYGCAEMVVHIVSTGTGVHPTTNVPACGVISQSNKYGKYVIIGNATNTMSVHDGVVGNILVRGPDMASGYWKKPKLTREKFHVFVDGHEWYDTGDLGFIENDQLYVTGRSKSVIIIQGKNYYPYDFERDIEAAHPGVIRPGCVAVCQTASDSIGVVAEVYPGKTIPAAKLSNLSLCVSVVKIIEKGKIPKTTSGKLRHLECKALLENDSFPTIDEYHAASTGGQENPTTTPVNPTNNLTNIEDQPSIAIIGAGPSGLVAAFTLVELGYRNITIHEKASYIGGRSVGWEGYDEIYIGGKMYDAIGKFSNQFAVDNQVINFHSTHIGKPVDMTGAGNTQEIFDHINATVWSKAGYGTFDDEHIPKSYMCGPFREICKAVPGRFELLDALFPRNFFKHLWGALGKYLVANNVRILLESPVTSLDSVTSKYENVIVSTMPKDTLAFAPNHPLVNKVQQNRYGFIAFQADGLRENEYIFEDAHTKSASVGQPIHIYQPRGSPANTYYSLMYAQLSNASAPELSQDELLANLKRTVENQLGGEFVKLHTIKVFDFFPHVAQHDLDDGFYGSFERLQGKDGVFWTGATLGFDLTETVSRHAHDMVKRHFPSLLHNGRVDVEEQLQYMSKVVKEVYPLIPLGPTYILPKHYTFKHTATVHESALWAADLTGNITMSRTSPGAAPVDDISNLAGEVQLRIIDNGNIQGVGGSGVSFNMKLLFTATGHSLSFSTAELVFPITGKDTFELTNSMITGEPNDVVDRHRHWLDGGLFYKNLDHVFAGEYSTSGTPNVFHENERLYIFKLVPVAATAPVNTSDYKQASAEIARTQDVRFKLVKQFAPEHLGTTSVTDMKQWNDSFPWSTEEIQVGELTIPRGQDIANTDHDASTAFQWSSTKVPNHDSFACDLRVANLMDHYIVPLSTAEFEERTDGMTNVEATLQTKLAFMFELDEVDMESSLLEIGATSFQLIQLSKYLESVYKIEFPVTMFFDLPTLNDVVEYTKTQISGGQYNPEKLVNCTTYKDGKVVPYETPVVWCLPPIIGSGVYRGMSKTIRGAVCELVDLSMYTEENESESLKSIAKRYADEIESLQPTGPYNIVGYSAGGVLAHAISGMMSDVANVFLLDTLPPTGDTSQVKVGFAVHENPVIKRKMEKLANTKLSTSKSRVYLMSATDQSFFNGMKDDALGWREIQPDVVVVKVPGDHLSIMKSPQVESITTVINEQTSRASFTKPQHTTTWRELLWSALY